MKKFGKDFLPGIPTCPGVYFIHNEAYDIIYIGKAKNLRRRLSQYKNAKRTRRHAKMRAIVAEAVSITYETAASDLDACLLETRLIQERRPKWNVAGAFFFLYPLIGLKHSGGVAQICLTTEPEAFEGFSFHGAYRSRYITRDAYFALVDLLRYIGHRNKKKGAFKRTVRKSCVIGFRQIDQNLLLEWNDFFSGKSRAALENLSLALLENAGARSNVDYVQERLNLLRRFWRHEATWLRRAIVSSTWPHYPVSQRDRDLLFLKLQHSRGNT